MTEAGVSVHWGSVWCGLADAGVWLKDPVGTRELGLSVLGLASPSANGQTGVSGGVAWDDRSRSFGPRGSLVL